MQAAMPLACFLSMIRPPGIQFENSLLQIAPVDKAKCPFVRDHNDIEFRLYTRHNPTVYQELYIDDDEKLFASNLDYHAPTVLFFHAFMENPDDGSAAMVREAYVLRGDTNVIMVDASRLEAGPWYFTAAENTWYIGKFAAQFVDYLVSRGLNLNNTHFVGHSLGAQAAGVAGSALKTGRVSRITGLDPALPLFHGLPAEQRLDTTDAHFVDIIHTDGGIFGVNRPMGHADFYPNGGISPQPGCELEVVIPQQMLLNKCDTITAPRGFYVFYLSPNKVNKNSIILEKKLQKFFTRIQALKSNEKSEVKPLKVDKSGLVFLNVESQKNPKLMKVETFESPIKTEFDIEENMNIKNRKVEDNLATSEIYFKVRKQIPGDSLKLKKLEAQESLDIESFEPQDSLDTRDSDSKGRKLEPGESMKMKNLETEGLKIEKRLESEDSIETRDPDFKARNLEQRESLKIRKPETRGNLNIEGIKLEDSFQTRDPDYKVRAIEYENSLKMKKFETKKNIYTEKLKPQEILKSRDTDSSKNLKTSYSEPQDSKELKNYRITVESQEGQKSGHLDLSDQTAFDDQIMVESVEKYRVLKPDYLKPDDFNSGTMKPVITENNDKLFVEISDDKSKETINKKNEEVTKSGEVDFQDKTPITGSIIDIEPLRLDLDRYLMPPRTGRYYKNFATKKGIPRNIEEVTITQIPPYFNKDTSNIQEENSEKQTQINSENQYYETLKQETQSQKSWQNSQGQSQLHLSSNQESYIDSQKQIHIKFNSEEQSQTDIKPQEASQPTQQQGESRPQEQSQTDSKPEEKSQSHSKPQEKSQTASYSQEKSEADFKSQEQSQLDSKPQEKGRSCSKPEEKGQSDSKLQEKGQTDSKSQEKSQTGSKPQQKSQINSGSSTKYKNHVIKRQKRFLNPFKSAETDQQDNFLFKLLDFVFKHRSKIPVYSVMREINTLVKSAHGELNHISKERNNYIGAPPPTLIPVSYTLELANENKVTAFVKKLLGLAPKGDRLTINGK